MTRRQPSSILTLLILVIPLVSGCITSSDTDVSDTPETRVIVDMNGREVTLPESIERFALFGGPVGQVAYILGIQDALCACSKGHQKSVILAAMDPHIQEIPAPRSTNGVINIEALLIANPQVVFAGDVDGRIVEKNTSLPVVYFMTDSDGTFDAMREEVRFFGEVFGKQEEAEEYCAYLDSILALIEQRTGDIPYDERPRVFNGYEDAHLVTYGGDTFMTERIEAAGCVNAAYDISTLGQKEGLHEGLDQVSMEQLLSWNPDILVINMGLPEDIYADNRWATVSAVQTSSVYRQPMGVFIWNRPSAESAVLYTLWLATLAYPERFEDIDMGEEIYRFYHEIFDYDLSDEQIAMMLSGDCQVGTVC
ncbi:MAG: ABC transporter substrate-binding protein [Candidatus Methanofastidiosa archaeon]|nr:ABC transporter substrate-binding protein [Candidatus Methanofastidiosa archaeon]